MTPDDLRALHRTRPHAELRETHISWVLLDGERALKLKKPVDFGFLDFSTLERRKKACEDEVHLNRRLAPDVYEAVVPITRAGDRIEAGGEGEVVDHGVLMRRLPDRERGDQVLARGELSDARLRKLARRLARFFDEQAETSEIIAAAGRPEAVAVSIEENFEQTREQLPRLLDPAEAAELERWQRAFLREQSDVFEARVRDGRIRDGHGDLRLDHVYFSDDGGIRILDCIEFNERLRFVDVAADVAFLAMDLGVHGHPGTAERFLALFVEATQDHDLYRVIDFYESYRAFVRGKIACFSLADVGPGLPLARSLEATARLHFRLALASERRPLLDPHLVGVMGMVGSGKSTVADRLSERLGAPVVSSDRIRKGLWGITPTAPLPEEAYAPEVTARVYDELLRRAELVARSGRSVIVDASFRTRAERSGLLARGEALGLPVRFLECRVSEATALRRLEQRRSDPEAVSDAGPELYAPFAASYEPPTELGPETLRPVSTEGPVAGLLDELGRFLPAWPPEAD